MDFVGSTEQDVLGDDIIVMEEDEDYQPQFVESSDDEDIVYTSSNKRSKQSASKRHARDAAYKRNRIANETPEERHRRLEKKKETNRK